MKKYLDILSIALPVVLVLFAFFRVDGKSENASPRIKILNGLTLLIAVALLLVGSVRYFFFPGGGGSNNSGPKPLPMAVSKHSDKFNNGISSILNAYYGMTEGFVNWDTVAVAQHANELKASLDNLNLDELKVDTTGIYESALDPLNNAKGEVTNILGNSGIDKKRSSLNSLSDDLRQLFIVVKYDREKLYWQECPMAFGEDKPGNWLSKTIDVRNPYLGNKHPEYNDKMLHCGEPKDTINFIPAVSLDTTKKAK